ncbi:lysophospholipid acyltransferase family protein [Pseudomonas sp. HK3]|jgi:1-acyl-sn-glycerol-3-phosphate acyltransferase
MLTILTAPFRAVIGFITLVSMVISAVLLYLFVNDDVKRKALIEICQRRLCSVLLRCFNVEIHYIGAANPDARMLMANHISWLDALLFMPAPKLRFIAKSEVKDWPIIGLLAQLLGTVFIRRENKFQVYRSLPNAQRHIREGDNLIIFPEGTTTTGEDALPFRPMMFEVAKRENCLIQPVAIRYWDHNKNISKITPFIGDDDILISILKLLLERKTLAYVHFLPALNPAELDRKQMASASQQAISQTLQQPYVAPTPDHRDAPASHQQVQS